MIMYDPATQTFVEVTVHENGHWYDLNWRRVHGANFVLVHAGPGEHVSRWFSGPAFYSPGDFPRRAPHFRCFLTGLVLRAKARKVCCDHADPESAFAEYRASRQNPDSVDLLDDLMTAIRRGNGGYVFSCLDRLDDAALGIAAAAVQASPDLLWWHGL